MKKQILNLGRALTKKEQRDVFGGGVIAKADLCLYGTIGAACSTNLDCCAGLVCGNAIGLEWPDENQGSGTSGFGAVDLPSVGPDVVHYNACMPAS